MGLLADGRGAGGRAAGRLRSWSSEVAKTLVKARRNNINHVGAQKYTKGTESHIPHQQAENNLAASGEKTRVFALALLIR